MTTSRTLRACIAAAGVLLAPSVGCVLIPMAAGCKHQEPPPPPPDQVYTVRGRITGLPQADKPLSELTILHEPIPSFVRQDGTLGMDSMAMPFIPAKGVSLEALAVGDIVEFTFEVRWKARPFSQLTRITKLPAETVLNLGTANGGH